MITTERRCPREKNSDSKVSEVRFESLMERELSSVWSHASGWESRQDAAMPWRCAEDDPSRRSRIWKNLVEKTLANYKSEMNISKAHDITYINRLH